MKRTMIMLIVIVLLVAPAMLPAATFWDGFKVPLGNLLGLVVTIFAVPALVKLSGKWGMQISDSQAQALLQAIIDLSVNLDFDPNNKALNIGKKSIIVNQVYATFAPKDVKALEKKYGSVSAAVEAAFQTSTLAHPVGK